MAFFGDTELAQRRRRINYTISGYAAPYLKNTKKNLFGIEMTF